MATANQHPKEMEQWQKEYGQGSIIVLRVPVSKDDEAVGYFVHPTKAKNKLVIYSRALTFHRKDQVIEAGQVVLNNCFLGGDERFKDENSIVHISAAIEIKNYLDFLSPTSEII